MAQGLLFFVYFRNDADGGIEENHYSGELVNLPLISRTNWEESLDVITFDEVRRTLEGFPVFCVIRTFSRRREIQATFQMAMKTAKAVFRGFGDQRTPRIS